MNFEVARTQMLGQQIRAWEVLDERVLRVLKETPREQFVPEEYRDLAFGDQEEMGLGVRMQTPALIPGLMVGAAPVVAEIAPSPPEDTRLNWCMVRSSSF